MVTETWRDRDILVRVYLRTLMECLGKARIKVFAHSQTGKRTG